MVYPKENEGNTKEFVFLEYKDLEAAPEAIKALNHYRLDKAHVLGESLHRL